MNKDTDKISINEEEKQILLDKIKFEKDENTFFINRKKRRQILRGSKNGKQIKRKQKNKPTARVINMNLDSNVYLSCLLKYSKKENEILKNSKPKIELDRIDVIWLDKQKTRLKRFQELYKYDKQNIGLKNKINKIKNMIINFENKIKKN